MPAILSRKQWTVCGELPSYQNGDRPGYVESPAARGDISGIAINVSVALDHIADALDALQRQERPSAEQISKSANSREAWSKFSTGSRVGAMSLDESKLDAWRETQSPNLPRQPELPLKAVAVTAHPAAWKAESPVSRCW
jgi:hypothetical protein